VIDFTNEWTEKAEIPVTRFIRWLGTGTSKFYQWRERYGKANEHNCKIPRDFWLEDWEKQAIIDFHYKHPLEGYRRLTFMMLDQDVVAVSPTSTWRVLNAAGLLRRGGKKSKKGTGFHQPSAPHRHWHIDVSHINIAGTFYYLCSVLDGYSRFIAHWELREAMTEADIELIIQRALERFPDVRPRIISDNGPQFIAKDFKEFVRICGMTHVKTSPYYPESNGKIERWHQSLKTECIRPRTPVSAQDARALMTDYVSHYNTVRLHSALGYVTPQDKLEGREEEIFRSRDRKLEDARALRRDRRAARRRAEGTEANAVAAPVVAVPAAGSAPAPVDPAPRPASTSESRGPAVSTVPETPVAQARIDDVTLRALRNDVPLLDIVTELQIPTTAREHLHPSAFAVRTVPRATRASTGAPIWGDASAASATSIRSSS